jgi:hypothetical protein
MALSMVKELEEKTLELYAALIILCVAYLYYRRYSKQCCGAGSSRIRALFIGSGSGRLGPGSFT